MIVVIIIVVGTRIVVHSCNPVGGENAYFVPSGDFQRLDALCFSHSFDGLNNSVCYRNRRDDLPRNEFTGFEIHKFVSPMTAPTRAKIDPINGPRGIRIRWFVVLVRLDVSPKGVSAMFIPIERLMPHDRVRAEILRNSSFHRKEVELRDGVKDHDPIHNVRTPFKR